MQGLAPAQAASKAASSQAWVKPRRLLVSLDSAATAIALFSTYLMLPWRGIWNPTARLAHGLTLTIMCLVLLVLLFRDGQYSSESRLSRVTDTIALAKNMILAYLIAMGLSFATKGFFTGFSHQSRLIVFTELALLFGLMTISRWSMWSYQQRLFLRGEDVRRVVVLGAGHAAAEFVRFLEQRPWLGIRAAGYLSASEGDRSLRDALAARGAEEIVVALDPEEHSLLPQLTQRLGAAGLPFRVVPSLFEESYRAAKLAGFQELPVVEMAVDPLDRVQRTFKRALDLAISAGALILVSPLLLVVALAIKITSPGPVLFSQERVGRNGTPFRIHKFRTMVKDAEERLAELEERNEADGHIFKIKEDPRVTRLGAFLRRWSIDEFPQFLNVLRGDMSVVGPRPPISREVECYDTQHFCRLKGKPGITGLWQVSGRSQLTFDEMVKLDRYYLENWSLGLDLSIILKTVYVVVTRRGAY